MDFRSILSWLKSHVGAKLARSKRLKIGVQNMINPKIRGGSHAEDASKGGVAPYNTLPINP
eukprot:5103976-Karenia_brevis.AAC.1